VEAEKSHTRPSWDAWIQAATKRRTIFVLYCFDSVFTNINSLETYPCDELDGLPAPAGKLLWRAQTREEWERLYNRWLWKWDSGIFRVWELKAEPQGRVQERRLQMWLEEVDEFGLLLLIGACRYER
jgi:hypothetical protein